MSFPINLVGDLLVVKPAELPGMGSIRLPDWKISLSGEVLATGPRVAGLVAGELVSFGAAVGMDCVVSGQTVRILKEKDIDFVYET